MSPTTEQAAPWVAKRFKCQLSMVMGDIRECAEQAVVGANQLMDKRRGEFPFKLEGSNSSHFKVSGWPLGPTVSQDNFRAVRFEQDDDNGQILVKTVEGSPDFRVFQRWNVKEEKCSVYVEMDGEEPSEYTADQIAQLALERLFFL